MPQPDRRAALWRSGWLVLACLLASVAVGVPTAAAHGGDKVGEAVAGPYRVELYAAGVGENGTTGIDYTAYLRRVATGNPVDDATVRIGVVRTDGSSVGPIEARGFANGYDVVVPAEEVAEREGQRVTVAIVDGPEGAAEAEIVVRSSALPGGSGRQGDEGGSGAVLWVAIAVGVALLLAGFVWVSVRGDRSRRRPTAPGG